MTSVHYPAQRPNARIAAAVISNTVYQDAMLALQDRDVVNGVAEFSFSLAKVKGSRGTITGPATLAIANMLAVFKKHGNPAKLSREVVMREMSAATEQALVKVAGRDGLVTANAAKKLPVNVRDDFRYITTGKL